MHSAVRSMYVTLVKCDHYSTSQTFRTIYIQVFRVECTKRFLKSILLDSLRFNNIQYIFLNQTVSKIRNKNLIFTDVPELSINVRCIMDKQGEEFVFWR